jgi:hypothetical protein
MVETLESSSVWIDLIVELVNLDGTDSRGITLSLTARGRGLSVYACHSCTLALTLGVQAQLTYILSLRPVQVCQYLLQLLPCVMNVPLTVAESVRYQLGFPYMAD